VKDTTGTPNDPDGQPSGSVRSGSPAGSVGSDHSSTSVDGADPAAATGKTARPDPAPAAADPAAGPAGSGAAGSGAAGSPDPTPEAKVDPPQASTNGRDGATRPIPPDAPTARIRMPTGSNGSTRDSRPADASGPPIGTPPAGDGQPTVVTSPASAPPPGPTANAGPMPHPGAAAASPPPWNRVPGQGASGEQHAPRPTGSAASLLDNSPTAHLMPEPDAPADAQERRVKAWSPVRPGRARPPRQAALQLKRLDPWSMLKLALVLAVVIFFIWLVAVGVLYGVLDGMGVWDRLNGTYADLVSGEAPTGSPLISAGRVFGLAAVIGAINSLLFAVAVTIGAFVYNVSADLVGGVEVTLSERD
jgi:hypothetical protein